MPLTVRQGRSNIVTATMINGRLQQTPTPAMTRTNGILVARWISAAIGSTILR